MKKFTDYKTTFHQLGYSFRLNEMNDSIECNGERLSDTLALTIESKMFDRGFTSAAGIRRSYTRLSFENTYHPIIEWWDGSPWDGVDYFGQIMNHIQFQHPQISQRFIWRFFLGCVGKVRNGDQNFMLVLDGVQGLGKSYLVRWFLPPSMRKYFVEGGLSPDHKDTKLRIIGNLLWEVGELQGVTKKADLEALKNIITQERITSRPAYARHDIDKQIICSFVGTVNENGAGFLNDVTGNRRFAVVRILNIDWDYTKINPAGFWSQVNAAYMMGERGFLTRQEQQEQSIINEEYQTVSHVEQTLHKHYEIDPHQFQDNWIPIKDILEVLELTNSHERLNMMELAGVLAAKGCKKSRSNPITNQGRAVCYSGLQEKVNIPNFINLNPWNPK